jgi:hypothetical protein
MEQLELLQNSKKLATLKTGGHYFSIKGVYHDERNKLKNFLRQHKIDI